MAYDGGTRGDRAAGWLGRRLWRIRLLVAWAVALLVCAGVSAYIAAIGLGRDGIGRDDLLEVWYRPSTPLPSPVVRANKTIEPFSVLKEEDLEPSGPRAADRERELVGRVALNRIGRGTAVRDTDLKPLAAIEVGTPVATPGNRAALIVAVAGQVNWLHAGDRVVLVPVQSPQSNATRVSPIRTAQTAVSPTVPATTATRVRTPASPPVAASPDDPGPTATPDGAAPTSALPDASPAVAPPTSAASTVDDRPLCDVVILQMGTSANGQTPLLVAVPSGDAPLLRAHLDRGVVFRPIYGNYCGGATPSPGRTPSTPRTSTSPTG